VVVVFCFVLLVVVVEVLFSVTCFEFSVTIMYIVQIM
jgi:hypothetical protein